MSFDVAAALRRATGRAKSDVANKLVSMFLHEVSRRGCSMFGISVVEPRYAEHVVRCFGQRCTYCGAELEKDRTSVEHLNGMNRICLGLHIPGNVAVACKRCNNEKRRDDQRLLLAENGWESFLLHDGSRCTPGCKTCAYWAGVWPDPIQRADSLRRARSRIREFQSDFQDPLQWSARIRHLLRARIEVLYRDCQQFATGEIHKLVSEIHFERGQPPRE